MCAVACWLVELYDARTVVLVVFQLSVEKIKVTFCTPVFPAVTVIVTVTWSLAPGDDGEMLGVLMLGPFLGAATMATAGISNSSERTHATFVVNDDIRLHNMSRAAGTYLSC